MKIISSEKTKQIRLIIERILESVTKEDQQEIVYITDIRTFRVYFYTEALKLKRVYSVNKSLQGNNLYLVTLKLNKMVDQAFTEYQEQDIQFSGKWYADAKKIVEELKLRSFCKVKLTINVKEFAKILMVLGKNRVPHRVFSVNFEPLDHDTTIIRRIS